MGKRTPHEVRQLLQQLAPEDELPLIPEFFDFAYGDSGENDPLEILLQREEVEGLTIEVITVGTHTSVQFTYKEKA